MKKIITIRASSLAELFDCPARWASKYIDNIRMPSNGKALLGTAVHASTAVYDSGVIENTGVTIEEAKAAAVDKIRKPDEEVIWGEDSANEAEKIALMLHDKYCYEIAPHQKYKAVEVKCEGLIIEDLGIALTGTTDRIYENIDGELGIGDIKTGKAAVKTDGSVEVKGHAFQQGVYELLAESSSGLTLNAPALIFGLNTAKTSAGQKVGIGEIHGARDILLGDDESIGILEMSSNLIHSGLYFGNPKSMMCHQNYCPVYNKCKYRK